MPVFATSVILRAFATAAFSTGIYRPDPEGQPSFSPDLGPNCLQRLSAEN